MIVMPSMFMMVVSARARLGMVMYVQTFPGLVREIIAPELRHVMN